MKPDKINEYYFNDFNTPPTGIDRRDFLRNLGGGVIIVFSLSQLSFISGMKPKGEEEFPKFNAFLRVKEDGRVDCYSGKIEMGQGINTSLAQTLAEELGLSFTSAFEDAIVSGEGLSDVLKGLEQDIIRIVTRKLVTEPMGNAITSMIGSAMGGSGGVIGGDFGNFLADLAGISFAGGGYTGSGARSGGLDGKGGFAAMLHPQETVVDHTKGQRLSGGNTVVVNISQQFAPGTTRATTLQAAADASRQLSAAGRNL